VAPFADISRRLVAAATPDSPISYAEQCAYPGGSGKMRTSGLIQEFFCLFMLYHRHLYRFRSEEHGETDSG
jgi:hypothetical protein